MRQAEPDAGQDEAARQLRRDYAVGMVKLGVWYVHHLATQGRWTASRISDALSRRVNLYRLTTLWDGQHDPAMGHHDPKWTELCGQLTQLIATAPPTELEDRAAALLLPWLASAPLPLPVPEAQFGCWSCRIVGEGIADPPGALGRFANPRKLWSRVLRTLGLPVHDRHVELHFVNATAPRSPFDDQRELARTLAQALDDVRQRHSSARILWATSWLNSRPEFLALFPESWRANAVERSPDDEDSRWFSRTRLNTDTWWGQFTRRDGSFNDGLARRFRSSGGVFPFPSRVLHGPIVDAQDHLRRLLSGENK